MQLCWNIVERQYLPCQGQLLVFLVSLVSMVLHSTSWLPSWCPYVLYFYLFFSVVSEAVCTGMCMVGIFLQNLRLSAGNPREWTQLSWEYRGDGTKTCCLWICLHRDWDDGNPTVSGTVVGISGGMELRLAGIYCYGKSLGVFWKACHRMVFRLTVINFRLWSVGRPWMTTAVNICWLCRWTVVFTCTQVIRPTTVHF